MNQSMMNCALTDNLCISPQATTNFATSTTPNNQTTTDSVTTEMPLNQATTCWGYWTDHYYPEVIHPSYPVYMQERAKDKGKQAFEIIKILKDKKLVNMAKVGDFIGLMDELIKIL